MSVVERVQEITGYVLLRKLGSGSYGDVWEGRTRGNRPVAVKVIDRTRGEAEARLEMAALDASVELNHPNLLQTTETWTEPDYVVIAMELADGNLRQRLDYCRMEQGLPGIPAEELLSYTHEAAQALDYLHNQGKLHRDVKPDNILLVNSTSPPAHAKIGDCGLLREMGASAATMTTRGTPAYIAPEVWKRSTLPQSDQYALAVTYVELRVGKRPYPSGDLAAMFEAISLYEPDLSGMEGAEKEVLRRALSKTPAQRYFSCGEFVEALEAALGYRAADYKPKVKEIELANRRPPLDTSRRPGSAAEIRIPQTPRENRTLPPGPLNTLPVNQPAPRPPSREFAPLPEVQPTAALPLPRNNDWRGQAPTPKPQPGPAAGKPKSGAMGMILAALLGLAGLAGVGYVALKTMNPEPDPKIAQTEKPKADKPKEDKPKEVEKKDDKGKPVEKKDDKGKPKEKKDDKGKPATPPPVVVWVPPGFTPAPGARLVGPEKGPKLQSRIQREGAVFVLLRPEEGLAPFYLMEQKATNALIKRFPGGLKGSAWRKGGKAGAADSGDGDRLPALRLTRPEAQRVAQWLGGKVPSTEQLDYAAGSLGEGIAAVGLRGKGPVAVDDPAYDDISPRGVRGLAGNGWEWTSNNLEAGGESLAVLRGQSYTAAARLTPERLKELQTEKLAPTQYPDVASPYTGFRVALAASPP